MKNKAKMIVSVLKFITHSVMLYAYFATNALATTDNNASGAEIGFMLILLIVLFAVFNGSRSKTKEGNDYDDYDGYEPYDD